MQLTIIALIKDRKWSLSLVAFISGAIVMALEFVTSRIFTPVFGSSIYTWGSLIGIVLTGLSLGYYLGGKIADKNPTFQKICSIIFSAGLYIVFIPFIAPGVIGLTISILPQSQYSSLFATFVLLLFPVILLGTVSPYVIKLGASTLKKVGNTSGNFYSLSTIGSIFGTFLTIFVLIPTFEIRQVIIGLGIVLMITSLIGLKLAPKIIVIAVIIILFTPSSSLVTGLMSHTGTTVYETETQYSHLDVTDSNNKRTLYLNGMRHSQMNLDDPSELLIPYTKFFHLGKLFTPQLENVLFVGGGGFSGPKNFLATYPDIQIDVVEIDPEVIDVARKYFTLNDNPRLQIFNDDARLFLSQTDKKYDLIILDAYATDYVPFHLLTDEYFQILDEHLKPNGVIISNLIGTLAGDTSDLPRAVYKTMNKSFPAVYMFTTYGNNIGIIQNIMIVATKNSEQLDEKDLLQLTIENSIEELSDTNFLEKYQNYEIKTDDVPVLTDAFSPVETLINPVTSQPYFNENSVFSKNDSNIWFSESTTITIGLLLSVVIVWTYNAKKIWKNKSDNHTS